MESRATSATTAPRRPASVLGLSIPQGGQRTFGRFRMSVVGYSGGWFSLGDPQVGH